MFTGSGSLIWTVGGCPSGLKPVGVMPVPGGVAVPDSDIVGPSRCLHEQHKAMIGDGNILKPRLHWFAYQGFSPGLLHLLDGRRVFLLKDLIGDRDRAYGRDVPGRSGRSRAKLAKDGRLAS